MFSVDRTSQVERGREERKGGGFAEGGVEQSVPVETFNNVQLA